MDDSAEISGKSRRLNQYVWQRQIVLLLGGCLLVPVRVKGAGKRQSLAMNSGRKVAEESIRGLVFLRGRW